MFFYGDDLINAKLQAMKHMAKERAIKLKRKRHRKARVLRAGRVRVPMWDRIPKPEQRRRKLLVLWNVRLGKGEISKGIQIGLKEGLTHEEDRDRKIPICSFTA